MYYIPGTVYFIWMVFIFGCDLHRAPADTWNAWETTPRTVGIYHSTTMRLTLSFVLERQELCSPGRHNFPISETMFCVRNYCV